LNLPYSEKDFKQIINGQQQSEKAAFEKDSNYIILDTGPFVLSVWNHVKYNKPNTFLKFWIQESNYDFVFLCKPDFAWDPDPLREHPNQREYLFKLYKELLNETNTSYEILEGNEKERMEFVLDKIKQ
jgi:nicotinamide riboside kinase